MKYRIIRTFIFLIALLAYFFQATIAQNIPDPVAKIEGVPLPLPAPYPVVPLNYIYTWTPSIKTTDKGYVTALNRKVAEVKQSVSYFDDFGNLLQKVSKGVSPNGNDAVVPFITDSFGRTQLSYLPYIQSEGNRNDGKFKNNPFASQKAFYSDATLNPGSVGESVYYSKTEFESSPLDRPVNSYGVGNAWAKNDVNTVERGGNHGANFQYLVNTADDSVIIWKMNGVMPVNSGYYATGQLSKTLTTDPVGRKSLYYKDKSGRIILEREQLSGLAGKGHVEWANTYFVFDDPGNLRVVVPPLAVAAVLVRKMTMLPRILDQLCFQYQYDYRNRQIISKTPGVGANCMVYDTRDRLAFSQNAEQRRKSIPEWLAIFYDNSNRRLMTAIYKSASSREVLQNSINTATGSQTLHFGVPADLVVDTYDGSKSIVATNSVSIVPEFTSPNSAELSVYTDPSLAVPDTNTVVTNSLPGINSGDLYPLTYYYYDNYNYSGSLAFVPGEVSKLSAGDNANAENTPSTPTVAVKGHLTGTKIRVLDTDEWLTTSIYYDSRERIIQQVFQNRLGGVDVGTVLYDFNNKILCNTRRHSNPKSTLSPEVNTLTLFSYDHIGRVTAITNRLNGGEYKVLARYVYGELGHRVNKYLGSNDESKAIDIDDYEYNINGWLQGINKKFVNEPDIYSRWFGEEISFDNGFKLNQYNGNIAGVKWKSGSDKISRAYGYNYDFLNRLSGGDFSQQKTAGSAWDKIETDFSLSDITYDVNGNILSMSQTGMNGTTPIKIDDLKYQYDSVSNRLLSIVDTCKTGTIKLGDFQDGGKTAIDYEYDSLGNILIDRNRGVEIVYNDYNLPSIVHVYGKGTIAYDYDAKGVKLRKTIIDSTFSPVKNITFDYVGPFVYKRDSLQYFANEEGRVRAIYDSGQAVKYVYDYFIRDHLGSVRTVLTQESDTSNYAATMEIGNNAVENALFNNIDNTRKTKSSIVGYPVDGTTSPNDYVAALNYNHGLGNSIGPSIILRVMAGDTIRGAVKAFYKDPAASIAGDGLENIFMALISSLTTGGTGGSVHNVNSVLSGIGDSFTSTDFQQLRQKNSNENLTDKPKAFLNYVLFDDQFKMVDENSGIVQVKGNPNELQDLKMDMMKVEKTGFLYIYTSNESNEDVYFDNLIISHTSGPLLENTHYYPFGLKMESISSMALKGNRYPINKSAFTGSELEAQNFGDGSGLEWYNMDVRNYDVQIGRWLQVDPMASERYWLSPYNYVQNNPLSNVDPTGMVDQTEFSKPADWFKNKDGLVQFSETVQSQADLQKGETYLGTSGTAINENNGNLIKFNNDGSAIEAPITLNSVIVTPTHSESYMEGVKLGGTMAMSWINHNINPLYLAFNGINSLFTHADYLSGAPMGYGHSGVELLSAIPFLGQAEGAAFKGGKQVVIGLGLYDELAYYRGTEVMSHLNSKWQIAGLTRKDYWKGLDDSWYFRGIFEEVTTKADKILFNVKNFDPFIKNPKMTNWEFNQIINRPELFEKTIFHIDDVPVIWTGTEFLPK